MSLCKKLSLSTIFILFTFAAFGQAARTPFSTFGIGEPFGNSLIQNQGMGGIGVSQPLYWSVNNQNPALLVHNYYTSFQAGALIESRTLKADTASQKSVNGNLNYLIVAFPVMHSKKRPTLMFWSTSVGLMPFTKVDYKILYADYVRDINNDITDTLGVIEVGSGGLTQLSWANGFRISEEWSAGIKASYIFGSGVTDYSNTLLNSSQPIPFVVGIKDQVYVKDFMFTGGLSFIKDSVIRDDVRVSAGLTYTFPTDLNATKNTVIQRRQAGGSPVTSDTLINKEGSVYIPPALTVGFAVSKGVRWSLGAEFMMQDWSKFNSVNTEDNGLEKSWRISLGGELTPNQVAFKNYFKRVTYRAGLSYEKTPYALNGNQLNDIGMNFGFSLPAGRSSLDWAFRIGKRGNVSETKLEETYYKIFFGITFNDQWFTRRRFD